MFIDITFLQCHLNISFVDDTTTFSVSNDPHNCLLQKAADYLVSWTDVNGMVINTSKTQEMVVYFGKQGMHTLKQT